MLHKLLVSISIINGALSSTLPDILNIPVLGPKSGSFHLSKSITGNEFYSFFEWETFDDPTHGRVNYVDQTTSRSLNLSSVTPHNTFIMRADDTNVVRSGSRGRDSNRIRSHTSYKDSVLVLDVVHMPWGCGTWPAFWTVTNEDWPRGGEIDIIEGANNAEANLVSLHTTPGCTMAQGRPQTGQTRSTDCNAYVNYNEGCGTSLKKRNSYGSNFNEIGGGWYVMKRTQEDGIYVWFYPRDDPTVPDEIRSGGGHIAPNVDHYGMPDARFPSSKSCDFKTFFASHNVVFDLTLCGDMAGSLFSSNCGSSRGSCVDYVDKNPREFREAYWEINALRIYTPEIPLLSLPGEIL